MIVVEKTTAMKQTCPVCDGLMPDDAVVVEDWKVEWDVSGPHLAREIYMHCPHCDHYESRTEKKPLSSR